MSRKLIANLKALAKAFPSRKVFVVLYNPGAFRVVRQERDLQSCLCAEIRLRRGRARKWRRARNTSDSVVIYQNAVAGLPPLPNAKAAVKITIPRRGAEIVN